MKTTNSTRPFTKKYKQLDPKKRDAFYEKHSKKIQLYDNSKQYLDAVMNGKKTLPIKTWQAEQVNLTADKFSLCEDFYRLKDEIRSVEVLRRGAENLMREENRRARSARAHDVKLL